MSHFVLVYPQIQLCSYYYCITNRVCLVSHFVLVYPQIQLCIITVLQTEFVGDALSSASSRLLILLDYTQNCVPHVHNNFPALSVCKKPMILPRINAHNMLASFIHPHLFTVTHALKSKYVLYRTMLIICQLCTIEYTMRYILRYSAIVPSAASYHLL